MRDNRAVALGWIRKAESDLANADLCIGHESALDTACFHAQQAAEKYLRAYLIATNLDFPFIHNLEVLIEICGRSDPAFLSIKSLGQSLTPYAVALRYDTGFWPSPEIAREARNAAVTIAEFVQQRLPPGTIPRGGL